MDVTKKDIPEQEAQVNYIVLSGSTGTDEEIDALCDIIRHSLRTQFGCRNVLVSIEEHEVLVFGQGQTNGTGYY
jgi:hypothetical protein